LGLAGTVASVAGKEAHEYRTGSEPGDRQSGRSLIDTL
jgi:hypothetical protein